ncbi:MAG TPA: creatininase family protein [Caulobacteraceae bacterium]|jgi:creatinine amidohydrolase/Fe(II)-dependent formamide hydrolase-like protein|nr:creatininase family protein [Caulobacteraceae bacterium]
MPRIVVAVLIALFACVPATARAPDSVFVEDLTWTELAATVAAGKTTAIIPVGGVEQSGPYIALGKHDARVRLLAERIARDLGNALVAPVVAYVPEGAIDPPTEHMKFPGTISVPPTVFRALLASAAASLRRHGFRDVVLIGDHGGYQADLKAVADDLNRRWAGSPARAHYVADYYRSTETAYVAALKARGYSAAEIGTHAGLADTALTLALAPGMVRPEALRPGAAVGVKDGVHGDPRRASAALGQLGVEAIVRQTVQAIRAAVRRP